MTTLNQFDNIYITGDTHGDFGRISEFCYQSGTTKNDVLVILGDAGINYWGGMMDTILKNHLSLLPITLFCIHGNHEIRPQNIDTYKEVQWHGGTVYCEKEFPNIIFAKDGEVYDFNRMSVIAVGGAYSIDKKYRIDHGHGWWADEQPSDEIKERVEKALADRGNKIDVILSHTTPLKYEPREHFIPGIDQSKVDKSTERWLDKIEDMVEYKKWYCGHYHINKKIDMLNILFEDIIRL